MALASARLVYQVSIANVFAYETDGNGLRRIMHHAYTACEYFCQGLIAAGVPVDVLHCDKAGDIAACIHEWKAGPGDLWADQKHPPID